MPTADATLLPPPFSFSEPGSDDDEPRSSRTSRSLDAVGVQAVLGAMIEHRRASQPSFASIVVPSHQGGNGVLELSEDDADDAPAREPEPARAPTRSEVFLKAR